MRLVPPPSALQLEGMKLPLPTPTDERGFVDIPDTIRLVQSVVSRNYPWRPNLSVHHFYWPESRYVAAGETARQFRELPIHKGLTLREFENTLHLVTAEVPVPDEEEMRQRIRAWRVAHALFQSVQQTVMWQERTRQREAFAQRHPEVLPPEYRGEDRIGREVLAEIVDRHFSGLEQHLERAAEIPPEHQLFDPHAGVEELASQLGTVVVPGAVQLVEAVTVWA